MKFEQKAAVQKNVHSKTHTVHTQTHQGFRRNLHGWKQRGAVHTTPCQKMCSVLSHNRRTWSQSILGPQLQLNGLATKMLFMKMKAEAPGCPGNFLW